MQTCVVKGCFHRSPPHVSPSSLQVDPVSLGPQIASTSCSDCAHTTSVSCLAVKLAHCQRKVSAPSNIDNRRTDKQTLVSDVRATHPGAGLNLKLKVGNSPHACLSIMFAAKTVCAVAHYPSIHSWMCRLCAGFKQHSPHRQCLNLATLPVACLLFKDLEAMPQCRDTFAFSSILQHKLTRALFFLLLCTAARCQPDRVPPVPAAARAVCFPHDPRGPDIKLWPSHSTCARQGWTPGPTSERAG